MEENWCSFAVNENKEDNKKFNSNIIEDDKPFEIDCEFKIKKRNHYSIENDILNNLYGNGFYPKYSKKNEKIILIFSINIIIKFKLI